MHIRISTQQQKNIEEGRNDYERNRQKIAHFSFIVWIFYFIFLFVILPCSIYTYRTYNTSSQHFFFFLLCPCWLIAPKAAFMCLLLPIYWEHSSNREWCYSCGHRRCAGHLRWSRGMPKGYWGHSAPFFCSNLLIVYYMMTSISPPSLSRTPLVTFVSFVLLFVFVLWCGHHNILRVIVCFPQITRNQKCTEEENSEWSKKKGHRKYFH